MDPFSITAGIIGMTDIVTKLSCTVARFGDDYKLADEELDIARQHALLWKEEIKALESRKASSYTAPRKTAQELRDHDNSAETGPAVVEEVAFAKALLTAQELPTAIEIAFPLRSEPHT
jgi:hypothetical protein